MYHRIDGKLVACGIIDILKTCLNSAYFIYDPEYAFLNLGVVGAIMEI
jgi:arginine-tRNA-protein transferase